MTPLLLAALLAGPAVKVGALGGATVVLGNESERHTKPWLSVVTDWNLVGDRTLTASAEADFTALPDAELALQSVSDFDAVEFTFRAAYQPSTKLYASLYAEGGFASRMEGDVPAATSAPLWSSYGLWFRDRSKFRGRLKLGIGPDERLGWGWTMAMHARGSVMVPVAGSKFGPTVMLDAVLGLETPAGQKQRVNIVRVSLGMAWGN